MYRKVQMDTTKTIVIAISSEDAKNEWKNNNRK